MTTADSNAADANQGDSRGMLPAGTRLQKYELLSVLGHGSFGITYRARDTQLDRDVAIKEYLPITLALREDGTKVVPRSTELAGEFVWGRERFLDEARTLARLGRAPAIVRVHDFLEANGTAYMVMALAEGETLESRLKRDGPLPAAVIEKIFPPLLDGLEQVHEAGVLHRDIKPANIVLDARDNPTLIDFGAARAALAGRSTAMPAIFTPGYAALEQFASGRQEPTTDIYGLSATLYRAIAGKEPPSAIDRAIEDRYVPLSGLALSGFAPGLLSGIDAGLALKASQRPQSIAEWRPLLMQARTATAGDAVIKPQHLSVVPPMATTPAQPAVVANVALAGGKSTTRSLLLAGVAAVLLLLAGGGYYAVISVRAQHERQRAEVEAQRKADEFAAQQKQAEEEERKAAADAAALARAQEQAARLRAELETRQRAEAEAAASAAAAQNATSLKTSLSTIRTLMAHQGRIDHSTVAHEVILQRPARSHGVPDFFNAEASNLFAVGRAGLPDQVPLAHGRQRQGRQGLRYGASVSPGHQPHCDQHGRRHDAAGDQGGSQYLGLERQPVDLGGESLRCRPQAIRGELPRSGNGSVGRRYDEAGRP